MMGKENGCVALIKKDVRNENADQDILGVHCIVHQEALCGKIMNLTHVMDVVLKCVNEIRSKGLKHRQFQAFLEEIDAEFKDVPYHTEVRWLSRGRILERFLSLRKYIEMFVNDKMPELKTKNGKQVSSFFSDPEWLLDLAFLVDITQHLNSLNTRLQGNDQLITEFMNHVKSFQNKLVLFQKQLEKGILLQFKSMQTILSETVTPPDYSRFVKHCEDLKVNFEKRFQDLHGRQQSLSLFENPFLVNAEDFNDADLQMEILDIQANSALQGFFTNHTLVAFYERVDREKLPLIHHNACFWAVQFGSTYVCEQSFSRMKVNKSKYRTKVTDKHLDAILRLGISPLKPNVEKLLEQKRMHVCLAEDEDEASGWDGLALAAAVTANDSTSFLLPADDSVVQAATGSTSRVPV
ncbi:hypothetical protein Pcinc_006472 [Petrolisthes cinctipes]|uniref:Uncharacterized protein n=1 Tax=Petrolisthes cinctipes TaxID=88211 RepID=A0AAE1GB99_PETCI|nr:hypothetical protein Pcinc_006472 [Petrolisthes cinctipes]